MSEKKYVAPEGMLRSIANSARYIVTGNQCLAPEQVEEVAEAVCRWLSENPIVPSEEQIVSIQRECGLTPNAAHGWLAAEQKWLIEWQRRMFVAPEPEVPEEVRDAIKNYFGSNPADWVKALAMEVYGLGKKARP